MDNEWSFFVTLYANKSATTSSIGGKSTKLIPMSLDVYFTPLEGIMVSNPSDGDSEIRVSN